MLIRQTYCGTCLAEKQNFRAHPLQDRGWNKSHLRWFVKQGFPDVLRDEFRAIVRHVFDVTASICGITHEEARDFSQADIYQETGRIDGPGGTLAQSYLPPKNPIPQLYDFENWKRMDLFSVALHEMGHAFGLPHDPNSAAVMAAYYKKAQGWHELDIVRLVRLYGPPKTNPVPPTDPTIPDDGRKVTIHVWDARKIEIPGYQVTKL